jgi:hypothetical protein
MSRQLLQQHEAEDPATLPVTPAPAVALATPDSAVSAALSPHQMLALQRTAGNAAIGAYLRRASLQRHCGGPGACDCADCSSEHEDDLENLAPLAHKGALRRRANRAAQHVPGKEELAGPGADAASSAIPSIEGEEEEEIPEDAEATDAAAAAPAAPAQEVHGHTEHEFGAGAAASAVPSLEGEEEEAIPESTPGQEVLQRARSVARSRMLQRAAAFAAGPVHQVNNLAAAIINDTPVGVTWPTLNGTQFWSAGEAQGLINRPTLTTAAAGAGFESQVDNIPNNAGSFDETVLANGPWRFMTTKANVVANVGALAGACGGAGNSRFRAYGKPSDAAMFAANRRHEDHHADDHRDAFNASIGPWDTALTNAKTAGSKFNGNTAAAAEAALWAAMGGTPDDVAADFFNRCQAAVITYHGSAAGGPVGAPENPGSRNSCSISWAKYTNPS